MRRIGSMLVACILMATVVQAAVVTWDGGGTNFSWTLPENWSDDLVPSGGNDYVISASSALAPADANPGDFPGDSLTLNNGAYLRYVVPGATTHVDTLTVSNATVRMQHPAQTSTGSMDTLNIDATATLNVKEGDGIMGLSPATLNLSGSAVKKDGAGRLNLSADSVSGSTSEFQLAAGALSLSGSASWSNLWLNISGSAAQYDLSGAVTVTALRTGGAFVDPGTYTFADFQAAGKDANFIDSGGSITVLGSSVPGDTIVWDGGAGDSSRWGTPANWDPDTAPNAADNFVFTGNSISAFSLATAFVANTLTGGDGSTLRIRSNQSLSGALIVTGSSGALSFLRLVESGAVSRSFTVSGSTTLGGTRFRFLVDQADDVLTLNLDALSFVEGSLIEKQGSGDLVLNATSLKANGNTLEIDSGKVTFGGTADYAGLSVDVTGVSGSGKLVVSNSITLKALTIVGANIATGVYPPGDPIYTTYVDRLLDGGGTLTVDPDAELKGYTLWAGGWMVDIGTETNDYDVDGLLNVYEYGLGGDPTNALDQGVSPVFEIVDDGGSDVFRYIHPQLSDPNSGLDYHLELNTDLATGSWVDAGYTVSGTNVTVGTLDFVTNTTDTVDGEKFIRLIIE